jgi:hypothetical protein
VSKPKREWQLYLVDDGIHETGMRRGKFIAALGVGPLAVRVPWEDVPAWTRECELAIAMIGFAGFAAPAARVAMLVQLRLPVRRYLSLMQACDIAGQPFDRNEGILGLIRAYEDAVGTVFGTEDYE